MENSGGIRGGEERTREIPRIELVEVDLSDDGDLEGFGIRLLPKVVEHELLVCWVESEAWR